MIGFLFPDRLKNTVEKFWSRRITVIALAKTGIEKISNKDVMIMDQLNKVMFINIMFFGFINIIDIIKFKIFLMFIKLSLFFLITIKFF